VKLEERSRPLSPNFLAFLASLPGELGFGRLRCASSLSLAATTDSAITKDWPPQQDFAKEFPELYEDFKTSIPCEDWTRLDGVLNVAVHFPWNGICPDLGEPVVSLLAATGATQLSHIWSIGPKMYNANASILDNSHSGSTYLHLDITDALNVMLWAANLEGGHSGYAVWHIFRAEDALKLRQFLWKHAGFKGPGDPIHSQYIYLTPALLQLLYDLFGIRPFTIYQYPGEVVFIPAGCAHQVQFQISFG
jgi:hypothetical protein